jgi:hypothetical protein
MKLGMSSYESHCRESNRTGGSDRVWWWWLFRQARSLLIGFLHKKLSHNARLLLQGRSVEGLAAREAIAQLENEITARSDPAVCERRGEERREERRGERGVKASRYAQERGRDEWRWRQI